SFADLVDCLVAPHPEDRPEDARAVLRLVGETFPAGDPRTRATRFQTSVSGLREPVLCALETPRSGVRYVSGAPGSGKSHVVGELYTRALLGGRPARLLRFPGVEPETLKALIGYLRNGAGAPFSEARRGLLLLLDDLHAAPPELAAAVEAFRCRPDGARGDWDVVAAVRRSPDGAETCALDSLDVAGTEQLLSELGEPAERARELHEASGGNAGFVVGLVGRVPVTRDAVL